tara:strand:- start:269 stop:1051 length:783 start_codon:yes stop_codon:yes gene_type:complete
MGFCFSYPLFLLLTPQEKIKENFYHFNLGLSIIIGSLGLLIIFFINYFSLSNDFDILGYHKLLVVIGLFLLSIITWYYWNKDYPLNIIFFISILGFISVSYHFYNEGFSFKSLDIINIVSSMAGTLSLSSVIFSMILGHWYLNIPNLPIGLIKKSVFVLNILLISRMFFNIVIIGFEEIPSDIYGNMLFLDFLKSFEGIFLWIGILFGIIGAIIINILTIQTIKLHSIQSATGLLYVNLIMILIGEMIFKYYVLSKNILL